MKTDPLNRINVPGSGLNKPPATSRTREVAREFESIFTSLMLRSTRKTVFEDELVEKSFGEQLYTEMLDDEYAKMLSNTSSFGLAEQIVNHIEQMTDDKSMLEALRSAGTKPWQINERLIPQQTQVNSTVQKASVSHWNRYIAEASSLFNVDKDLIAAVITQESAGNPYAVSPAGAKGLMQLMDTTARDMGVQRVFNPRENILGGVKYLDQLLKECDGDERLALASYNAGPEAVKKYGGIPPYQETQNYVARVIQLRDEIKFNSGKSKDNVSRTGE